MGTRSIIKFYGEYGTKKSELVTIYQQWDGYIEGVGFELAEWLMSKKICNGISDQTDKDGYCNGVDCLVAQFIRDFKKGIGNLYIVPSDCEKQDFNYEVIIDGTRTGNVNDLTQITVTNWDETEPIFVGKPSELLEYEEEDEE